MTDYNLRYRFSASGQADVARAFQSIATAAGKAAAAEAVSARRGEQAAQRAATSKEAAAAKGANAVSREANKVARAEAKLTASVEREAKKRSDAEVREIQRVSRIRQREAAASARIEERAYKRRAAAIGRFGDEVRSGASGMALSAGAAGTALVGAAARKEYQIQSRARDLSISTRGSGQAAVDHKVLAREAHAAAAKTPGVGADDILGGMKAFTTKTGDLGMARKLQSTFATLSSASGASATDIGGTAASLMQKFGITDTGEMQKALGSLYMQGKSGSFELADAAEKFPTMAAAAQRFGLDKGAGGVQTLGGLAQIARESTGSADQAGTAVEAMFRQLVSRSGDLKSEHGVEVFNKDGTAKPIEGVLTDLISKVGGDDMVAKKVGLQKVMGDEGIRAITPLIDAFATAVKDGKDPVVAITDKLNGAIHATGGWTDVVQDASMAQQSDSAKVSAAWDSLAAKVGDAVLPELSKLVDAVARNDGALTALARTAGVLLEGLNAFAKALGIVAPTVGAEKDIADKKAALVAFDQRVAKRQAENPDTEVNEVGLTPAEQIESNRLEADLVRATEARDALSGAMGGKLSKDEYQAEYERLGNEDSGPTDGERIMRGIINSMAGGGVAGVAGFLEEPETEKQKRLTEAFTVGRDPNEKLDPSSPLASLAELAGVAPELIKAAQELTTAAGALGKGSKRGDPLGQP